MSNYATNAVVEEESIQSKGTKSSGQDTLKSKSSFGSLKKMVKMIIRRPKRDNSNRSSRFGSDNSDTKYRAEIEAEAKDGNMGSVSEQAIAGAGRRSYQH